MSCTLHVQHDRFALTKPFRIARGERIATDVITVTLEERGVRGRGEGVPYARYGETIDSALASVEQVRRMIEMGAVTSDALTGLLPPGAARNAVDCAIWDLQAKSAGQSVAGMIGAPEPERMASALTIVIDTPEAMATAAAELASSPLLKIKVDAQDPATRIRAVRAAAPQTRLIVDPNESWDEELVRSMEDVLVEARVDMLEQPVPAQNDEWLRDFQPRVPICADEAVHVAADLDRVARLYQMVNVKLDKTGGLSAALELARETRARGLGLMTGCMVSSSLSIAPAMHIARMSDFVDLDGPIWLKEDRLGGVRDDHDYLLPPAPGFWGTP